MNTKRVFVAFYHFNGWRHISLGLHVCLESPNLEIHVPFGFFRIGWSETYPDAVTWGESTFTRTTYGFVEPPSRYRMTNGGIVDMHASPTDAQR